VLVAVARGARPGAVAARQLPGATTWHTRTSWVGQTSRCCPSSFSTPPRFLSLLLLTTTATKSPPSCPVLHSQHGNTTTPHLRVPPTERAPPRESRTRWVPSLLSLPPGLPRSVRWREFAAATASLEFGRILMLVLRWWRLFARRCYCVNLFLLEFRRFAWVLGSGKIGAAYCAALTRSRPRS
jgi:hypothetical protein